MFWPWIWNIVGRPWVHLGVLAAFCFVAAFALGSLLALGQGLEWTPGGRLLDCHAPAAPTAMLSVGRDTIARHGFAGRVTRVDIECAGAPEPGVADRIVTLSHDPAR